LSGFLLSEIEEEDGAGSKRHCFYFTNVLCKRHVVMKIRDGFKGFELGCVIILNIYKLNYK
jgi:hypothetical protein